MASKAKHVALCLSGGGYRAALYHLGAMRRLHEVGLLERFDTWSCVSGGSILAGFLATNCSHMFRENRLHVEDWEREVAQPFRKFVKTDRRTWQVAQNISINLVLRKRRVASYLKSLKKSFGNLKLGELPTKPNLIFCATDMTFGVNWVFEKERIGSYSAGYATPKSYEVAQAVAASSCFPPVFGPFHVDLAGSSFKRGKHSRSKAEAKKLLDNLMLTDGGLYDNLGTEPVFGGDIGSYILFISDAGAPFDFSVSKKPISLLRRYTTLAQEQGSRTRKRFIQSDLKDKKLICYWWIKHDEERVENDQEKYGYSRAIVTQLISKIRTDLDFFSDAEAKILENHGYACAQNSLVRYAPKIKFESESSPALPHQEYVADHVVRKALASSHKRISAKRVLSSIFGSKEAG